MDNSDAKLYRTLQLVNEWLKFGEAKNGALVTLNGVGIAAMHNLANLYKPVNPVVEWWIWIATACCLASLSVGLSSFYSRTKTPRFQFWKTTPPEATSALYFGHLAEMTPESLLRRLVPEWEQSTEKEALSDMAGQVITNARIAKKKFALFNVALMLTLAGALTPAGLLLYYWRLCDEEL